MMADMMSMMTPAAPAPAPKKKAAKRKPAKKAAKKKAAKKTTKKKAAEEEGRQEDHEEEGCQEDDEEEEGRPEEEGCQEDHEEEEGRPEEEGRQEDRRRRRPPRRRRLPRRPRRRRPPRRRRLPRRPRRRRPRRSCNQAANDPLQVCDGSKTGGAMPPVFNSGGRELRGPATPGPAIHARSGQRGNLRAAGRFPRGNGTKRADRRRCAARSVARVCGLTAPTRRWRRARVASATPAAPAGDQIRRTARRAPQAVSAHARATERPRSGL